MNCERASVEITKYSPLSGGAAGHAETCQMPTQLKNKKSILSIVCSDQKCFLWSLIAHFHPTKDNPIRVKNYIPFEKEFNMGGATYPIKLSAIKKVQNNFVEDFRCSIDLLPKLKCGNYPPPPQIEQLNNLSINVFLWDEKEKGLVPCHHGCSTGREVDLLLCIKGGESHYVLIKKFGALLR